MKALALCAGIGGIEDACEKAGIQTVAFCEKKRTAAQVLKKNWPKVPIFEDIKWLNNAIKNNEKVVQKYGISKGKIDLVTCGWPCQSFSTGGKRGGREDERGRIFDEALAIARNLDATWLLGENVLGATSMEDGIDFWIEEMGKAGFESRAYVYSASAVGTNHQRYRVFLVGFNTNRRRRIAIKPKVQVISEGSGAYWSEAFLSQSEIPRVKNGLFTQLDADRLELLGNAVCPPQVFPLIKCIKAVNDSLSDVA